MIIRLIAVPKAGLVYRIRHLILRGFLPTRGVLISPEPAIVHVGDRVAWKLSTDLPPSFNHALRWTIYFEQRHPFRDHEGKEWEVKMRPGEPVIMEAGKADEPGDYKYGVKIENAETGEQLSDDDPYIIVLR